MAIFKSAIVDKIVSSRIGFIHFKNGIFETENKDHIDALSKAIGVHIEDSENQQSKSNKKEISKTK